jgi:hypothetical protein
MIFFLLKFLHPSDDDPPIGKQVVEYIENFDLPQSWKLDNSLLVDNILINAQMDKPYERLEINVILSRGTKKII